MDLSNFPDNTYDLTLLLGPLYHLYCIEDKRQALSEAIRVTKQNGIIFVAYVISDGCLLDEGFQRSNINVAEYLEKGLLNPETFASNSQPKDLFELVRKEDIDNLMSVFSTKRLHYVATDGCALFMREIIDNMDDKTFELYLKYHYQNTNELSVNPFNRIVIDRNGHQIQLTAKEFDLLYFLSCHKGQVFTKEQLYENVWGYNHTLDASNLTSFIRKLRLKIEPTPEKPRYIITVWGVGYKFSEQEKP